MTARAAELEAGRELDALVAEKVLGWRLLDRKAMGWLDGPPIFATGEDPDDEDSSPTRQNFNPSEVVADAWLVVEVFDAFRSVRMDPTADFTVTLERNGRSGRASAPTFSLAACRAALAAVSA